MNALAAAEWLPAARGITALNLLQRTSGITTGRFGAVAVMNDQLSKGEQPSSKGEQPTSKPLPAETRAATSGSDVPLVQRLRKWAADSGYCPRSKEEAWLLEAADEIERLTRLLEVRAEKLDCALAREIELRAALEWYALFDFEQSWVADKAREALLRAALEHVQEVAVEALSHSPVTITR